jgi:hypothetical protein
MSDEIYVMMRDGLQVWILGSTLADFVDYLKDVRQGNWTLEQINTPNRYAIKRFDEKRNLASTNYLSQIEVKRAWNRAATPRTKGEG